MLFVLAEYLPNLLPRYCRKYASSLGQLMGVAIDVAMPVALPSAQGSVACVEAEGTSEPVATAAEAGDVDACDKLVIMN